MLMNAGTRLFNVAALLLALPCLSAPQKVWGLRHYSVKPRHSFVAALPADPYPVFDHNPMSIKVGNVDEDVAYDQNASPSNVAPVGALRSLALKSPRRVISNHTVTLRSPLNKLQFDTPRPLPITVYVSSPESGGPGEKITLRVLKDLTLNPGVPLTYTLTEADAGDCTIEKSELIADHGAYPLVSATFRVTFHSHDTLPHKFCLVAFKTAAPGTTSIQTVNVYRKSRKAPAFRHGDIRLCAFPKARYACLVFRIAHGIIGL